MLPSPFMLPRAVAAAKASNFAMCCCNICMQRVYCQAVHDGGVL
jgi:hypothetical protein